MLALLYVNFPTAISGFAPDEACKKPAMCKWLGVHWRLVYSEVWSFDVEFDMKSLLRFMEK